MMIYDDDNDDDFPISYWVIKCKSLNSSRLSCKVEIILLFPLDITKCNMWGFVKCTILLKWKDGILCLSSLSLCKPLWESTAGGCLTWQWEAVIHSQQNATKLSPMFKYLMIFLTVFQKHHNFPSLVQMLVFKSKLRSKQNSFCCPQ